MRELVGGIGTEVQCIAKDAEGSTLEHIECRSDFQGGSLSFR